MASENSGLRYTDSGSGEPVVLLDWTPWESRVLSDSLSAGYRVISLEPPAQTGDSYDVAEAVAKTAEAAGLDAYALVGTSLGADAAFKLALLRPQSVSTLVVVSPSFVEPSAANQWHTPEQAANVMLAHPANSETPQPGPERTALLSSLAEKLRADGVDAPRRLAELICATLVVFGQEDRLVSRGAGGIWKAEVLNCSLSYVYDAGHAIAVDRPDALTNVVLDFVERRETFIVENRPSVINP